MEIQKENRGVGRVEHPDNERNFGNALVKIKSTFQNNMQIKSEFLDAKMRVFSTAKTTYETKYLSAVQSAMTNFYMIKVKYQKVDSEEVSEREIEPTAIFSFDQKWLLIAWCHLRNDFRTFRLDRIIEYKLLNKKFGDRNFDFRKHYQDHPYEVESPLI